MPPTETYRIPAYVRRKISDLSAQFQRVVTLVDVRLSDPRSRYRILPTSARKVESGRLFFTRHCDWRAMATIIMTVVWDRCIRARRYINLADREADLIAILVRLSKATLHGRRQICLTVIGQLRINIHSNGNHRAVIIKTP